LNDRRRSKQHTIQAEKEIILSAIFTACSDVFSAFEHYQTSTRHSFDMKVAACFQQRRACQSSIFHSYVNPSRYIELGKDEEITESKGQSNQICR
ncbi:hypothetical protein MKW98_024403, partial [Papaver atlanticum]